MIAGSGREERGTDILGTCLREEYGRALGVLEGKQQVRCLNELIRKARD